MRVSVVIPVHNRQAPGERALRSALAQGLDAMEVIVVDDGSQPPFALPADIAAKPNVRLVRHDQNRGAAAARNTGIGAARADWIALLDSDDYWLTDTLRPRLESAERTFENDHDPMILHAAGFVVDNRRTGRRDLRIPRESASAADFASGCWFSPGSTILFRKETFDRIGPWDPTLPRLEDLDWFLRFALAGGRLKVWDDPAAVVETGHKPGISSLEEAARRLHAKYTEETSPQRLAPELVRRLEAYLDVERASVFAVQKRWLRVLFHAARSVWRVPRFTVPLEPFWRHGALPPRIEPAGAPISQNRQ
jgi:glycosyltransferase involved in cell wall biosynthesis